MRNFSDESAVVKRFSNLRSTTIRELFRRLVLDVLSIPNTPIERLRKYPRVQLLILHHVFPDEEVSFRKLLKVLQEGFQFITLTEAVERIEADRIDRAYLVISFDDGLKCCRRAAEIMNEFDAKGCFFVCPPLIGELDFDTIERFCRDQLWIPPVEFLNWDDVEWLLDNGHEIGGHTMGHLNLGEVPLDMARQEIGRSFNELKRRIGRVEHFAWPYGRFHHFRPELLADVFDAGYRSCASAERGCHTPAGPVNRRELVLLRDSIVAGWPISHIRYFLNRSIRRDDTIPTGWPAESYRKAA